MRMFNHARASGYDRLADYMDAHAIQPSYRHTPLQRAVTRPLRFLIPRSESLWYHYESLYSELCAGWQWIKASRQIFHFLYGENSYRYLANLNSCGRKNFVVSTYHTPPERFRTLVRDCKHLTRLDAIIVVSTTQMDFFCEFVEPERVFYVPHGIDIDYFKPGNDERTASDPFQCLFVGTHLRDFKTLARAAQLLGGLKGKFHFVVVTFPEHHHFFQGMENVEVLAGVSDEVLLNLYQSSDALVLPLLSSTANNTLLEAMACGLPLICTDVEGVSDYVSSRGAILTPVGDPEAIAEAAVYLEENEEYRREMGRESRVRALEFRWEKIASMTQRVYERVTA